MRLRNEKPELLFVCFVVLLTSCFMDYLNICAYCAEIESQNDNENDYDYSLNSKKELHDRIFVSSMRSQNDKRPSSHASEDCCDKPIIIDSAYQTEGYLKAPPLYDDMHEPKNFRKTIECLYKFRGKANERIQLFYEDFDLYYPYDINKFYKIDCRYADSICLKFYDLPVKNYATKSKNQTVKYESLSLEPNNYDLCNCINVSFTPRQILSANNFLQVRFKTVPRLTDSQIASQHSRRAYRGYIVRYRFITDFGIDTNESGLLNESGDCKVYLNSTRSRDGYFSSPNYPGLYPRDILCHYYFFGDKTQKVQITFHTFDVEGVEQCTAETKSDYVELSNFQNRDRQFSRFCGLNKPGSIISDGSFFHVTFYSNNVFDGKGFEASYHFINIDKSASIGKVFAQPSAIVSSKSSSSRTGKSSDAAALNNNAPSHMTYFSNKNNLRFIMLILVAIYLNFKYT